MAPNQDFRIRHTDANRADYAQLLCDIEMSFWGPTGSDADKAYVAQGTPGQRALFVLTLFARLVDNGGLMSFYECASFYSREVTEALELLQFPEMQRAFSESLTLLCRDNAAPEDEESGRKMLQQLSVENIKRLEAITDLLYGGSGVEERLFSYFTKYVDAHPQEFFKD